MAELDFSPLQNLAGQAMGLSRQAIEMRNDAFRSDLAMKTFQMNEKTQNIQNKIAEEELAKLRRDNELKDIDGVLNSLPIGPKTKAWAKQSLNLQGAINSNNMSRVGDLRGFLKTVLTDKEVGKQFAKTSILDAKDSRDQLRQLAELPPQDKQKALKQMGLDEETFPQAVQKAEDTYNQVMTIYDRGEQAEKVWNSIPDADKQLYIQAGVNPNVSDPIALQVQIQKAGPEVERLKLDFAKKKAEAEYIKKPEALTEIEKLIAKRDKLPAGDPRRKPFDDRIAKLTHIPGSDKSSIKPDVALKRISAIDEKIAKVKTGEISEMQAILMQMLPAEDRAKFRAGKTLSEDDKAKVIEALEREKAFLNSKIPEEYRQTKELDEETASKIFIEAGRDKEKARKLAKERGYTF